MACKLSVEYTTRNSRIYSPSAWGECESGRFYRPTQQDLPPLTQKNFHFEIGFNPQANIAKAGAIIYEVFV